LSTGAASVQRALEVQAQLAPQVRRRPLGGKVRLVAGADCCYAERAGVCASAVVVWDLEREAIVETRGCLSGLLFPYVPGLLAFREAPPILRALHSLCVRPDLLICDGQGAAHPRRFGLACHVGVLAQLPTVGCGKTRLCGTYVEPGESRGSRSPLTDGGEIIGTVLRTRSRVRPVFVSVGHLIDLPGAERVILGCARRYRLPEPLRLAHQAAEKALRRTLEGCAPP
jgi:deoxyribonuclease V